MNYEYKGKVLQEELMNPMNVELPTSINLEEQLPKLEEGITKSISEPDPYAQYTDHAKYLQHYVDQGILPSDFEINPDATPQDVAESLRTTFLKQVKNEYEPEVTEEDLKIVRYLKQGGKPESIQETYNVQKLAKPNKETLEDRKATITAFLNETIHIDKYRNSALEEAELDDYQDDIILNQAISHFETKANRERETYLASQEQEAKRQKQVELDFIKTNTELINRGKIKDFTIPKANRASFIDALFKQTETVTIQTAEGDKEIKVPKGHLRWNEVMSDPEEYLTLMYGVLFGYTGIKNDIIKENKKSALDSLNTAVSTHSRARLIGKF